MEKQTIKAIIGQKQQTIGAIELLQRVNVFDY